MKYLDAMWKIIKRVRNEYGRKIRKQYDTKQIKERMKNMRSWKISDQEWSNTLTGIQLDNLLISISPKTKNEIL